MEGVVVNSVLGVPMQHQNNPSDPSDCVCTILVQGGRGVRRHEALADGGRADALGQERLLGQHPVARGPARLGEGRGHPAPGRRAGCQGAAPRAAAAHA